MQAQIQVGFFVSCFYDFLVKISTFSSVEKAF